MYWLSNNYASGSKSGSPIKSGSGERFWSRHLVPSIKFSTSLNASTDSSVFLQSSTVFCSQIEEISAFVHSEERLRLACKTVRRKIASMQSTLQLRLLEALLSTHRRTSRALLLKWISGHRRHAGIPGDGRLCQTSGGGRGVACLRSQGLTLVFCYSYAPWHSWDPPPHAPGNPPDPEYQWILRNQMH